jgi:hypothetical protein
MLLRLLTDSRIDGAPSQPALYRLTKKTPTLPFLRKTPEGWRVETDDPSWMVYLARASSRSIPQKVRRTTQDEAGPAQSDEFTPENAEQAGREKLIQQARNERIKAESACIDLEVKRGVYVEREKMVYLLSFIQQGITNGFEQIKKRYKDHETLALLCEEMEQSIQSMVKLLEKELING